MLIQIHNNLKSLKLLNKLKTELKN